MLWRIIPGSTKERRRDRRGEYEGRLCVSKREREKESVCKCACVREKENRLPPASRKTNSSRQASFYV